MSKLCQIDPDSLTFTSATFDTDFVCARQMGTQQQHYAAAEVICELHRWCPTTISNETPWCCIDCALFVDIDGNVTGRNMTAFGNCRERFERRRQADSSFDVPRTEAPATN